jgi:hypothetical protein
MIACLFSSWQTIISPPVNVFSCAQLKYWLDIIVLRDSCHRALETSQAELLELKEELQAASEDCVAAAMEALSLPTIMHPSWGSKLGDKLGHVQLMALGLTLSMAEARHPHENPTIQKPDAIFQGPFRSVHRRRHVTATVLAVHFQERCTAHSLLIHG